MSLPGFAEILMSLKKLYLEPWPMRRNVHISAAPAPGATF
jgi:hypothetical protein